MSSETAGRLAVAPKRRRCDDGRMARGVSFAGESVAQGFEHVFIR
jgi:hypothetical protein